MKKAELAKIIDQTDIRRTVTEEEMLQTCEDVKKYNFRGLCVNPQWVKFAREHLPKAIKVIALIDPPLGISGHEERANTIKKAKKDGADEVDVVMNIIDLKYERYNDVLTDLTEIAKIMPTKVIIGSGYLTDNEIKKASEIVAKSGAICVKTATEKDPLDRLEIKEKIKHVKIMKESAPGLLIKASGAISTLKDARVMIKAGADLIGTSFGPDIVKRLK